MAKKLTTRKTRTTTVADTSGEITVEDVTERPARPPAGIETWLIVITLAALVAAFLMINIRMRADFGSGWPF